MEKLLHWSIEASKNPEKAGNPDPELISKLFSGYDDHTAMKVNLREAVENKDIDSRVEALEVFEELVENVDNANDLGNLWAPLLFLCSDPEHQVRQLALSSVAYAVQNNDKAQGDLLKMDHGIPILMQQARDPNTNTASKALFATASAIGHNPQAYDAFVKNDGMELTKALVDELPTQGEYSKRDLRIFSLLYSIINLDPKRSTIQTLRELGVLDKLKSLSLDHQGKLESILQLLQ